MWSNSDDEEEFPANKRFTKARNRRVPRGGYMGECPPPSGFLANKRLIKAIGNYDF